MTATPECRCKIRLSSFVEHPKAVTPNVDDLSSAKGDRENGLLIGWKKCWCPWPDSNQHALRHSILSRARLPISPQGPNRVSGAAFRQAIRRPQPTIRKLAAAAAGDCVWLIPKINCAAGVAGSSRLRQHVSGQPLRTGQDLRSSARRAEPGCSRALSVAWHLPLGPATSGPARRAWQHAEAPPHPLRNWCAQQIPRSGRFAERVPP